MKTAIIKIRKIFVITLIVCAMTGAVNIYAATIEGTYPVQKGMILVTSDWSYGVLPSGHAAIVWDENTVIEAQTGGVMMGLNDWMSNRSEVYGVQVKGLTQEQCAAAADWCMQQLGKPYNYNYLNKRTRDEFYCSQLVWAAFYDLYNIDLSIVSTNPLTWTTAVHPMELVNSDKTETIFHFQK